MCWAPHANGSVALALGEYPLRLYQPHPLHREVATGLMTGPHQMGVEAMQIITYKVLHRCNIKSVFTLPGKSSKGFFSPIMPHVNLISSRCNFQGEARHIGERNTEL